VLVVALTLSRALAGSRFGRMALLAIAFAGYLVWRTPLREALPDVLTSNLDDRYFGFLIFFVLGLFARNGWLALPGRRTAVLLVAAGGALYVLGYSESGWFSPLGFLLVNVGVIAFVPALLEALSTRLPVVGGALVGIGRNSLWIYLLHPFVTEPLRRLELSGGTGIALGAAVTVGILAVATAVLVVGARSPRRLSSAPTS
jgi:peptidoglycan/LPS O-acetylase OafA/YrhL